MLPASKWNTISDMMVARKLFRFMETIIVGFVSGIITGIMLLAGTWVFMLPRIPNIIEPYRRKGIVPTDQIGRWIIRSYDYHLQQRSGKPADKSIVDDGL